MLRWRHWFDDIVVGVVQPAKRIERRLCISDVYDFGLCSVTWSCKVHTHMNLLNGPYRKWTMRHNKDVKWLSNNLSLLMTFEFHTLTHNHFNADAHFCAPFGQHEGNSQENSGPSCLSFHPSDGFQLIQWQKTFWTENHKVLHWVQLWFVILIYEGWCGIVYRFCTLFIKHNRMILTKYLPVHIDIRYNRKPEHSVLLPQCNAFRFGSRIEFV